MQKSIQQQYDEQYELCNSYWTRGKLEPEQEYRKLKTLLKKLSNKKIKHTSKFIFLTVSVKNTNQKISFSQIENSMRICEKNIKRVYIEDYYYSLEQRAKYPHTNYHGLHLHIGLVVRRGKRKCELLREFQNGFKEIADKNCVDLREFNLADWKKYYDDKIEYLLGNKWDKGKELLVKNDNEFRKQFNLKTIYRKSDT